jgi:anti-anti-sigma regulatory factor
MSIENAIEVVRPLATELPCEPWRGHTLRLFSQWLDAETALVTAEGAVDASNADHLGEYALRVARRSARVVLDFSALEFFGTAGFSALQVVTSNGEPTASRWVLVPSAAVAQVLRICDPQGAQVVVGSVDAALAALQGEQHPVLQLVAQ